MNAFATIYFHNYLRMDEMPRPGPDKQDAETDDVDVGDASRPGLHISTFTRQLAFDILYFIEFVILLGCGFSAQIVKDGYLGLYTDKFVWVVTTMTLFALILKFFYYNVLHIWRNTIFTTTRLQSQPFTLGGHSKKYEDSSIDQDSDDIGIDTNLNGGRGFVLPFNLLNLIPLKWVPFFEAWFYSGSEQLKGNRVKDGLPYSWFNLCFLSI